MASRERSALTWAVRIALLAALSLVVGWLLLHRLSRNAPPRWSQADLLALPADADNGWPVIARATPRHIELPDSLGVAVDPNASVRTRRTILTPAAGALIALQRERRDEIARVRAAYERPRFVDSCAVLEVACHDREVHYASDLMVASGYGMVMDEDLPEAYALAGLLLTRHLDLARSARRMASATSASDALDSALAFVETLEVLLRRLDVVDVAGALPTLRAEIRAAVGALLEDGAIDPRRVVIFDYLVARRAMDARVETHRGSRWMLDRHATTLAMDDHFGRLYDYATGTADTMPPERNLTTAWHFRLHNPAGKRLLTWLSWHPPDLPHLRDRVRETRERAAALLPSLDEVAPPPRRVAE